MESFIKSIQGHQLEFNKERIGYYNVSPKNVEYKGVLSFQKDERGVWNVNESENLPGWFNEISMYVHFAIEENETKENSTSGLLKYACPF